jgi:nucleotide-binding universal stress UspA family protein
MQMEHIVVGVDGSDVSRNALNWAYEEAAHHGASLTVVTTWHPPALPMTPPYGQSRSRGLRGPAPEGGARAARAVHLGARAQGPCGRHPTSVEEGKNPSKVLIERSKEADLVVVGSRGHGGFAGMLLGSVSQHLVAHAECPVVVVR